MHFLIQIKFVVIFEKMGVFFSLHDKIDFNFWAQRLEQEDFFSSKLDLLKLYNTL